MTRRRRSPAPVLRLATLLTPGRGGDDGDPTGARPESGDGRRSSEPADPADLSELLAVADRHGLVPAVWSRLLERGAVDAVPDSLRRFVADRRPDHGSVLLAAEAAHAANAVRIADLLDQADGALRTLSIAGLRVAPLKGVDALLTGRYADPAARTMTDIDLLVDATHAARAAQVLADVGYRAVPDAPPNSHQLPAVQAPGRPGSIELHTELATDRWADVVPAAAALDAAVPAQDRSGLRLTRTDSLTHLVLHAQLHDEAHLLGRLALRSLHETALALAADEDVDWDEVDRRFGAVGRSAAVRAHLQQVQLLFRAASPLALSAAGRLRAQAVIALDEHPDGARYVEQVAYLPRALSAERMADLHGASGAAAVFRARLAHVARGVRRSSVD